MNVMTRLMILMMICLLAACSRSSNQKNENVITIESHAVSNTLFYTGTIQPLKTIVISSPADGVVVEMPFQYGESVQAGQLLFMISSSKFLTDYKSALMQYIKAKSEFNNNQMQLKESEFLHKNELISDDDYKMKKANFYAARLSLLQAKDSLENLLQQLNIKNINLYKLSIADIDKITQALHLQVSSENLKISAPAEGVALSPNKNEDEIKKVLKGDMVKQGDVLAVIGDMNGLSVRIKVNELTVNELKVGQNVTITGIAFPEYTLSGKLNRIDRQGEPSNGGVPIFMAEVVVPQLTLAQQKIIHAGMTAKVEINIDNDAQIMIPISAIIEKNGESYVQLLNGKIKKEVLVKTGKTTSDAIAILSGLKIGDHIVSPN